MEKLRLWEILSHAIAVRRFPIFSLYFFLFFWGVVVIWVPPSDSCFCGKGCCGRVEANKLITQSSPPHTTTKLGANRRACEQDTLAFGPPWHMAKQRVKGSQAPYVAQLMRWLLTTIQSHHRGPSNPGVLQWVPCLPRGGGHNNKKLG